MLNAGKNVFSITLRVNYTIGVFFMSLFLPDFKMLVNAALSHNRIVKSAFFAQCIVGFSLLISACSPGNSFSDGRLRDIVESTDRRDTSALLLYLSDEEADKRIQAVRGLASFCDSSLFVPIMQAYIHERDESVQTEILFALGQNASYNGMQKFNEQLNELPKAEALIQFCIAAGKCGAENILLNVSEKQFDESAIAAGLFYYSRTKRNLSTALNTLAWKILRQSEHKAAWMAAHAIMRAKSVNSDSLRVLTDLYSHQNELETQQILLQLIAQCGEQGVNFISSTYKNSINRDYRIRLACLNNSDSLAVSLWLLAARDADEHVRNRAIELLGTANLNNQVSTLNSLYTGEKNAFLKTRLAGLLLSNLSDATRRSLIRIQLLNQYKSTNDEFIKGHVLKALGNDIEAIGFLEEELFSTPSILIREFAFEALLNYRRSPRFAEYRQWWSRMSKQSLDDHYISIFRYAIESADVSMVSLAASFLREKHIPFAFNEHFVAQFNDIRFMEETLSKLVLPRDIEAYSELLKTISVYKGLEAPVSVRAPWNNPIRWELLERIPKNQQVEMVTPKGIVRLELWVDIAPATVAWFVHLIQNGFYTNKRLHRVVPGFVIQDGCPRGDGFGSTLETIRSEFSNRNFEEGVIGMASAGPDTESCQWFITHTATPHLNGRYTAFGKVISGMEVVHQLQYGDAIAEIRLVN